MSVASIMSLFDKYFFNSFFVVDLLYALSLELLNMPGIERNSSADERFIKILQ